MSEILEDIKCSRNHYYKTLMKNLEAYIYREKRYSASFSLVTVCNNDKVNVNFHALKKELRETDTIIPLNDNLFCIVFDSATSDSYLKAAENLNKGLQKIHYKEKFFISSADSQEFDANYLDMTNKLFERLEYALVNNIYNSVIYQDYII